MRSLDNPVWNALSTSHSSFALSHGQAKRYPPQVAPFVATPADIIATADINTLVRLGERVCFIGIDPLVANGWKVHHAFTVFQYVYQGPAPAQDEREIVLLGPQDVVAMVELTALVYPSYFRSETSTLGDYFGIYSKGHLCAMAGIRMRMKGFQEVSAICTHPDHRGRGLASRLTNHLLRQIIAQGDCPFLHPESDNVTAQSVYEKIGFHKRAELPVKVMDRE